MEDSEIDVSSWHIGESTPESSSLSEYLLNSVNREKLLVYDVKSMSGLLTFYGETVTLSSWRICSLTDEKRQRPVSYRQQTSDVSSNCQLTTSAYDHFCTLPGLKRKIAK